MNIWEIDARITELVDPETGEILDFEAFDALQMEREAKLENLACWVIELKAEAAAIKAQEDVLADRRQKSLNKAESVKRYLDRFLAGEKFETPKVSVSYRKAPAHVEYDDQFMEWARQNDDSFLRYKDPEVSKKAISDAIKAGKTVPHAWMVDGGYSLTVK